MFPVQNWLRDKLRKYAELRGQVERMPPSPERTALLDQLDSAIKDPLGSAATYIDDKIPDIGDIGNATLDVVRGLGGAIVDGLDGAYDAAKAKLDGKEPDVVAGLVVVVLTVMTGVYLYHSAKYARDAF
tara:strand:+ start:327 stop:713 length:387 start_codon:yes stop_codon:yes gene_type:complete